MISSLRWQVWTPGREGDAAARPGPTAPARPPREPGARALSPGRPVARQEVAAAAGERRGGERGAGPHGGAGARGPRGRRRGRPGRAVSELHVLGAGPGQRLAVERLVPQKPGKAAARARTRARRPPARRRPRGGARPGRPPASSPRARPRPCEWAEPVSE